MNGGLRATNSMSNPKVQSDRRPEQILMQKLYVLKNCSKSLFQWPVCLNILIFMYGIFEFAGQKIPNAGYVLWMMTLERALSQFAGHAFVPVMLHCVHLFCKLCNQLQGPKWQASRGDSSAKTSCPEKLQQELAAVTRVPERIDFNGRNNSSLWGRRRNAKSPTRTAKVWQGLSQPSCEPGMCCSNLWARLGRQLVEIFGYFFAPEIPDWDACHSILSWARQVSAPNHGFCCSSIARMAVACTSHCASNARQNGANMDMGWHEGLH